MDDKKKRRTNWGSLIGWLIFILVIAGGPILGMLRRALSGVVTLPSNLLLLLIGGLVALSILVSVIRALGSANRSSTTRLPTGPTSLPGSMRLPTTSAPPPSNAPMPPFGGPSGVGPMPPTMPASPRSFTLPQSGAKERLPPPPRFEPIFSPRIVAVGVLGLVALGALALLVLGLNLP